MIMKQNNNRRISYEMYSKVSQPYISCIIKKFLQKVVTWPLLSLLIPSLSISGFSPIISNHLFQNSSPLPRWLMSQWKCCPSLFSTCIAEDSQVPNNPYTSRKSLLLHLFCIPNFLYGGGFRIQKHMPRHKTPLIHLLPMAFGRTSLIMVEGRRRADWSVVIPLVSDSWSFEKVFRIVVVERGRGWRMDAVFFLWFFWSMELVERELHFFS